MGLVIRKLKNDDIEIFAELLFEFFTELRRKQGWSLPSMESIRTETLKSLERNDIILIGYLDNRPVGFIRVSTHHEDLVFWVDEIFVLPEFRRQGIGRRLVRAAEKEVLKRGEKSLYLYVLPQEVGAIAFWKSVGYTILNAIELVRDIQPTGRGEVSLTVELLGEPFDIVKWPKSNFGKIEKQFMELLRTFYKNGGDKKTFLKIVSDAIKAYINRERKTPSEK